MIDVTNAFHAERPRLVDLAARILADPAEAEDVAQQAWLRLRGSEADIDNLPAWLTTVTTRLCLDRLRARTPVPHDLDAGHAAIYREADAGADPAEEVALADTVGIALQVVLERLTPRERVAFVLHDTFAFDFPTIAAILDTTAVAARKLASRARAKVTTPTLQEGSTDWQVVDAFMAAARGGDLTQLLQLLAPDVQVRADAAAAGVGTPERLDGRDEVAGFFNGSASAALAVSIHSRPAAAWFHQGQARVLFDFTITAGLVRRITFRAEPDVLAQVVRRDGGQPHG